jgi:hypothetical protein
MRVAWILFSGSLVFLTSAELNCQQTSTTAQRDPQATALLQSALRAMGGSVPSDSSASGSVTLVEGSTMSSGTIQVLTRGTTQTSETLTLSTTQRAVIYSYGEAKEVSGTQSTNPPLELIVTEQCPDFPLPLLASVLNNSDEAFRYIAQETLNGVSAQHIQVWNTFSSKPRLLKLASFSTMDIWFDATSGFLLKIAYSRRAGAGAVPTFTVEAFFSNYTNVGGVLYPFKINKSYNGTPWQTITIQSVSFNTGLTAGQFQTE